MKTSKTIIITIFAICIIGFAFVLGRQSMVVPEEQQISSQVLLKQIQEQAFLVTKTLFLDETVTITVSDKAGWKGIFTGDELQAQGLVRVDVGVDLKSLTTDDIVVDHENRLVSISLPDATILDSSLFGDLEVKSEKGIFTSIRDFFTDKEVDEYNQAVMVLQEQAQQAIQQQADLLGQARVDTLKAVNLLVSGTMPGYRVQVQ